MGIYKLISPKGQQVEVIWDGQEKGEFQSSLQEMHCWQSCLFLTKVDLGQMLPLVATEYCMGESQIPQQVNPKPLEMLLETLQAVSPDPDALVSQALSEIHCLTVSKRI